MDKCAFRIIYKQFEKKNVVKEKFSKIENFESLRKKIIDKTAKMDKDIVANGVTNKDKFILQLADKLPNIESVFNDKTLDFLRGKVLESQTQQVVAYITKVDKYPEWSEPQTLKIFKDSLDKASKETIEEIKKDLILENLENGNRVYIKEKKEEKEICDDTVRECHIHIFCNHCQRGNFFGFRYMCAECNNYNLCEECYSNEIYTHNKEHTFIRIKKPLEPEDTEINNYSSIFSPNRIYEKRELDVFQLKVNIINNGIVDLKGCFISPIRFGKKYLSCSKEVISEEFKPGEKKSIEMNITFYEENEEHFQYLDQYIGYYRLMTEKGIPFGDILYIQLDIKD